MLAAVKFCLKTILIFESIVAVSAPICAGAAELSDRYFSVRAMGMGNAYSPIATGIDSLFYNPSGLALNKGITLTPLSMRVGTDGIQSFEDARDFGNDFAGTLRKFYGKELWVAGGANVGVAIPNFAIAGYDSANLSGDLSNPALPSFQVDAVNDYGAATGFGFELVPGFMRWGVSTKRIYREGGTLEIPVSSLATLDSTTIKNQLENHGVGTSVDTGIAMTIPSPVKPTFSATWRDIGNTSFQLTSGMFAPPTDNANLLAGFSLEIPGPLMTVIPVIEASYLNDSTIPWGKKLNAGVEMQLPIISLRAGFHQGYYTAGAGFNMGLILVDIATYGVELGQYPGQREDRRYALSLTIDFGFDFSSGSFVGMDSENRSRLKQRR